MGVLDLEGEEWIDEREREREGGMIEKMGG